MDFEELIIDWYHDKYSPIYISNWDDSVLFYLCY